MNVVPHGVPVIIGGGVAGLTVALASPGSCTLVVTGSLGDATATSLAQGGIAAATGSDDSAAAHAADTLAAGGGLARPEAVRTLTAGGRAAIRWLLDHEVAFDTDADGHFQRGLEGAHSRARILHCDGDGTGAAMESALVAAVRQAEHVTVLEDHRAVDLVVRAGRCHGVTVLDGDGRASTLLAPSVVLATGGYGALFAHTTNPLGSWGSGLALAIRAGAATRDLEFVQFHPTALDAPFAGGGHTPCDPVPCAPMSLVSEAVRGAGARLVTDDGTALVGDALAARDVVARAVWRSTAAGRRVFLDTHHALGPQMATRFPGVSAACRAAGIDPCVEPVPVRPAAHYTMGGIAVDLDGRTSVPGLLAVGECASTGVHGANRLASNSLLEAVVFGRRVAGAAARTGRGRNLGVIRSEPEARRPAPAPPSNALRGAVSATLGIERDPAAVQALVEDLAPLAATDDAALVASCVATSALSRTHSVGAHTWNPSATTRRTAS